MQVAGLVWVKDIVYLGTKEVGEVDKDGLHVTLTAQPGTLYLYSKECSRAGHPPSP